MTTLHLHRLRIAHPKDRRAVLRFLERLSPSTVQSRYLSAWSTFSSAAAERETRRLVDGDPDRHVVILATDGDGEIRGIGEFVVEQPGRAEVALMVEDAFQHRGIARSLFRRLRELARQRGISTFTADVSGSNFRMQDLFRRSGIPQHAHVGSGQLRFTLWLDAEADRARPVAS